MEGKKTEMVQTKVSAESYARLKSICKQYGITLYDLIQMFCDCIIRFMDSDHNLDENLLRIIRMFEGLPGWRLSMRLTDEMDENVEIVEAFYVIRHRKRRGATRVVHVLRPMLDGDAEGWTATYNIQTQLERFIELTNNSLYMHLRRLAVDLGTESMLDVLHTIANLYQENPDEKALRLEFENNDWHERGKKVTQDTIYSRRRSHSMDYMETRTLFDDPKAQDEENEANEDNNN